MGDDMAGIGLPGDAVGRGIPLGTMVPFDGNGNVYHTVRRAFATGFDLKGVRSNSRQATHARVRYYRRRCDPTVIFTKKCGPKEVDHD